MADYDSPRPSSQEVGTTEQVVAKDNLITFDKFINADSGETVKNRKGVTLTTVTQASESLEGAVSDLESDGAQAIADFESDGAQAISDFETSSSEAADAAIASFESQTSAAIAQAGYEVVGNFSDGVTVANRAEAVYFSGDYEGFYTWTGTFPKTVTAGDNPFDEEGWMLAATGYVKQSSTIHLFGQTIDADLSIPSGQNGLSINPSVSDGVTVTVPDGSDYVILGDGSGSGSDQGAEDAADRAEASATAAAESEANAADSELASKEAQEATEDLFDNFDSSVADSVSLFQAGTPSLSVPFNESGRLDYGVGTEYVTGLPVYGVDFTCSTGRNYQNKSGIMKYADVDEIAIGTYGAWAHGGYTNSLLYSDDLTGASWVGSADVGSYETINGMEMALVSDNNSSANATLSQYFYSTLDTSANYTTMIYLKYGGSSVTTVALKGDGISNANDLTINWNSDGTISSASSTNYNYMYVGNGIYRFMFTRLTTSDANTAYFTVFPAGFSSDGSTTGSVYVSSPMIVKGQYLSGLPYIGTSSSASSSGGTDMLIPCDGNLPPFGLPFSVMITTYLVSSGLQQRLYTIGATDNYISIYLSGDGSTLTLVNCRDGVIQSETIANGVSSYLKSSVTVSVAYDGDYEIKGYLNETLSSTTTLNDKPSINAGNIIIGRDLNYSYRYYGMVSDFKVYDEELTENQVKVLVGV